mmetsp:Transcript_25361/g.54880  ORF Transcript_25361/g.54880 Transcript_25361/m.54880 type:complete len:174 (+) Transcript_25361:70-591(+)|eukprot:CAMPEP_0178631518 /NCGR_PEP_ID=MMETSP0698-20121128/11050_1 /TAXON_ID=265572 /ORGANISM="Extubocellulus spinifer, Strain CCMP396" /LENGTH=173 /DNA_ID=CAMNT_0020270945 /DNA_START=62 /DNA_END=583 /DNA_ORIENTATION=+
MPTVSIANFCDVVVGGGGASTSHDKREKKAMLSIDDDLFSIGTLEESDTSGDDSSEDIDKSQMDLVASTKKSTATGAAKPNEKADESVSTSGRSTGIYKHSAQVHDGRQYGAVATDDVSDRVIEIIDETDDLHLDEKYSTSTKEQDDEDIAFNNPYKMYATMGVAAPVRFSSK